VQQAAATNSRQRYTFFPNPGNGTLSIVQDILVNGFVRVRVSDVLGSELYDNIIEFSGGKSQVNLTRLPPGMYVVDLFDGTGIKFVNKIIIEQ